MPNLLVNGKIQGDRVLTLASGSPRRRELIQAIDTRVSVVGSGDYEPPPDAGESPQAYVRRLALLKARRGITDGAPGIVLGADTSVVLDGEIFGKPVNADEAFGMLERLRGRPHEVVTGIAVADAATGVSLTSSKSSKVYMREYSAEEIAAYVESGEPFDKAGAYAVQDKIFRPAERVEGCYLNTVGLPLCDVLVLLARIGSPTTFRKGWDIPSGCPDCDFWSRAVHPIEEVSRP